MFLRVRIIQAKSNQTYGLLVQQVGTDSLLVATEDGEVVDCRGKWTGVAVAALYGPAMKGLVETV